jgi:putative ABC transport system permease protein
MWGVAAGSALSLILVRVINRQSFHWSMELHFPVLQVALLGTALIAMAIATAVVSGRRAMSGDPIAAVREDW